MHDRIDQLSRGIAKAATGINGLDELTGGGLPVGRPTLICGGAGCGKTLLSMTFLVNGARLYDEPGVFMAFEERSQDLASNVSSLGYDLEGLIASQELAVDYVRIERSEIEESGEYDLEGLFIRLNYAIDSIGAKRVVLDTIEALFGGLSNETILRAELRRLFEWLKNKGVTAIITGERGDGQLTRHGLEEYVSDCVVLLENRIQNQAATRHLRIVKYRGTSHGSNEYPFLIDEQGITVMPVTSLGLNHVSTEERVSSGIPALDEMLEGKGYFRGSSILASGMAGAGKSSIGAHFANATCAQGERCIYFAFEESPQNILRNMRSIGIDLKQWVDKDLLRFSARRPTLFGLEMHLASMYREVTAFKPSAVIVDPVSSLITGSKHDVQAMLLRLIDFLKSHGVTALCTSLTHGNVEMAQTDVQISSLMDTWLLLYNKEANGEHNRQLYLLKSRGMKHSNQVREFLLTDQGIQLRDVYVGPDGVVTGSARLAQEARIKATKLQRQMDLERRRRELDLKRARIRAEIQALEAEVEAEALEVEQMIANAKRQDEQTAADEQAMAASRKPTQ